MSTAEPDFNLIARPYRLLEYLTFGRALERTRIHFLRALADQKRALVLGDGDGRFLARLFAQNQTLYADAVDTSSTMLRLLRQRCEATTTSASYRLCTHHTNALTFAPANSRQQPYDLVVTHFFVDCFTQADLESLISRIAPTLAPKALWLISDFRIPTGPMRLPSSLFIGALYTAFRFLTGLRTAKLPNHAAAFTQAGLTRTAHHYLLAGLLSTELWQLSPQGDRL